MAQTIEDFRKKDVPKNHVVSSNKLQLVIPDDEFDFPE